MTARKARAKASRRRAKAPTRGTSVHVEAQDLKTTVTPSPQWRKTFSLGRLGAEAGAIIALAGLVYGAFDYVIPYLDRQWNSDGAPLEGKVEHAADIRAHLESDQKLADQLSSQAMVQRSIIDSQQLLATKQRGDFIESLNNRMRNLQGAIDVAKANAEKDPSAANQRVLETLQAQMPALQRQIMETAVP